MRMLLPTICFIALAASSSLQASGAQQNSDRASSVNALQARKELEAMVAERSEAASRNDTEKLKSMLAPDFSLRLPNGKSLTGQELEKLSNLSTLVITDVNEQVFDVERISIRGDRAVLDVRYKNRYKRQSTDATSGEIVSETRQQETFVRTADGWKLQLIDKIKSKPLKEKVNGGNAIRIKTLPSNEEQAQKANTEDEPILQAGQGIIFIYRFGDTGWLLKPPIHCDGVKIAEMTRNSFVKMKLPPGSHVIRSEIEPAVTLNVEAGKIYYLVLKFKSVFPKGRGFLEVNTTSLGPQIYKVPKTVGVKPLAPENIKDSSKIHAGQ
ncbi:MAG: DUF2846 domain-containing protein [Acidobacteriota bacterium]|nr:DUF2846 domain-containing protein [Acidobacteriota bacterium]